MLQGKPHHNTDLWFQKKELPRNKSTYKDKNSKEAILSATCSILTYSDWPQQYCPFAFLPANRTEWTPQVTVPSRDTKCLILKTWQKKIKKEKRGGEAIWKPDLDMDTWSDAWQTKLFRQKEAVALFQTKYSPITRFVMTPHWSNLSLRMKPDQREKEGKKT